MIRGHVFNGEITHARDRYVGKIFVSTKYNSRITSAKRRNSPQVKSSLCTKKYFQSDGVFEDAKEYKDTK